MRGKFLAEVLAASLVLTMAPVVPNADADAAQKLSVESQQGGGISNLPGLKTADATTGGAVDVIPSGNGTLTCTTYRESFTKGILVGKGEAKKISFKSVTNANITKDNWNAAQIDVFSNSSDTVDVTSTDYKEYGIIRSDIYVNQAANGPCTLERTQEADWDNWITDIKAGINCEAEVSRSADGATLKVVFKAGTGISTTTIIVDAEESIYFALTGENCVLSELPDDIVPSTGGDEPTPTPTPTPDEPDTPASELPAPVLKYTFDNAEGLELAGEANVADGVLNLATTATSHGSTYAKLPDISDNDFSNGITLVADVNVKAYASDWTPIFMFGDGTIGGEGNDATGLYHFSQGFSSVGGSRAATTDEANWFVGYFGNGISAPYTWDYFNNEANRNAWNTIAVTITNSKMTTYINGVQVQSSTADYKKVIDAFKVAKNNYLGTSYWANDIDFAGSLDNVAIYNAELSAAQVKTLTSSLVGPIKTPAPLASYPIYTSAPTAAPPLPSVAPEPTPVLDPETLTGTAWWTGNQKGRDYTLKGEGTLDLYIAFNSNGTNEPGAFSVELLSDSNKYITTGSDINIWTAEGGEGTVSGATLGGTISVGHVYKVSITRTGYDFTVVYYDLTDNKEHCTLKATGTNQGVDVNVHVMAQVGTFIVSQTEPDSVAPVATATPDASASPSASPEPGTTPAPEGTPAPGNDDNNNTPGNSNNNTPNDTEEPNDDEEETKKTMKVSGIKAKKNTKKVTGTVSVKGAKVKVKVGSKAYKNAKVSGKKFTFTASSKLKKGTKITIKITKSGYKTITKTVKVK